MKRLLIFGILTVAFLAVMILWDESLGVLQFPVLTLGCLSGFFLVKRVFEMFGYRRPETLSARQRKQEKLFVWLIIILGGIGFLTQIALKILLLRANGK